MKKIILLVFSLSICSVVMAQGIDFRKESYAEILAMAEEQDKLVFIDVYTSWCGPCRHMAKDIFTQKAVGDYFNARFLCMKVDAEKNTDGRKLASEFGISSYPTCLFVDGRGKMVYRFIGGRQVEKLLEEGQKALSAAECRPKLEKFQKKYEGGRCNPAFLLKLYELKNRAGLDCSDVLLDYFAQTDDEELLGEQNLERISKVAAYDPAFAERVVGLAGDQLGKIDKKKEYSKLLNRSVGLYLSAALKDVSRSNDSASFERVMHLKDVYFKMSGNRESVSMASISGQNIYAPSGLKRLDYYSAYGYTDTYLKYFERYMLEVEERCVRLEKERKVFDQVIGDKIRSADTIGSHKEVASVRKMAGLLSSLTGIDNYFISVNMIGHMEKYMMLYKGAKDGIWKNKVCRWYVILHELYPSVQSARIIADVLVGLGRTDKAVEVLELALEKGKDAKHVTDGDIRFCEQKLEDLNKIGKEKNI